eukprot:763908-Hanusia_phi.AAC.1
MKLLESVLSFLNVSTLDRKRFIFIARMIACLKIVFLAYLVVWSFGSGQCFKDLAPFAAIFAMGPFLMCLGIFFVEVAFWMVSLYKRMVSRMYSQSLLDANRNLLSLCTKELCQAQKFRIQGLNILTDVGILIWFVIVAVMYSMFLAQSSSTQQCVDYTDDAPGMVQNSCIICELQPLVAAYACFLGVSVGTILKTVVLASHGDFTLQSRVLENVYYNPKNIKNMFWIWITCSELRQLYSATLSGLLFLPALFLILVGYGAFPSAAQVFIAPLILVVTFAILIIDGGIIYLPWRIFSSLFTRFALTSLPLSKLSQMSRSTGETVKPFWGRRVVSMESRPQRKVVASFLWFLSVPWIGGCLLANMGALGGINKFAAILLFLCVILTLFLFGVHDREMSVKQLLARHPIDNYGLVMSREHLVSEFKRILDESKSNSGSSDNDTYEVSIPTYLASQDRIDLSAVVSYRWSDSTLYKEEAPRCFKISLTGNDGFNWKVKIVEPMVQGMVDKLSSARQEYVWMDQFSNPQWTPEEQNEGEAKLAEEEFKQYEKEKECFRIKVVSRMIGLYASAGVVIAFNNTADTRLNEEDWYENRLWCVQEYSYPERIEYHNISNTDGKSNLQLVSSRRSGAYDLWFKLTSQIHSNQVADVQMEHECAQQKILFDWDHSSSTFSQDLTERVVTIGASRYLADVEKLSASNRNDVLPAFAQACFGIIMSKTDTKLQFITNIISCHFKTSGQTSLDVIVNTEQKNFLPAEGSMCVDRMLSGAPVKDEKGDPQCVMIKCDGTKVISRNGLPDLHVTTGVLLSPAGFQEWVTTLECIEAVEPSDQGKSDESRLSSAEGLDNYNLSDLTSGGGKRSHQISQFRLVKMTVVQGSTSAVGQEILEFTCV